MPRPPHSHDVAPYDYFLWGFMKMLRDVFTNYEVRLNLLKDDDGNQKRLINRENIML